MDFTSQFLMSEISFQVKTHLNFNYIIMGRDTILIRDGNPNPESAVFFLINYQEYESEISVPDSDSNFILNIDI